MTMVVQRIHDAFANRALLGRGAPMYDFATGLEVLDAAEACQCRIFGIDGLHITPTTTQPDTGHTLDISYTPYGYEAARAFLMARRGEPDLFFEIVLDEPV